jgi:S1-C subfamily serine protease
MPRPQKRCWLLCVLLLGLLSLTAAHHRQRLHNPHAAPRPITPRRRLRADEKATMKLFQKTSPSVVYITTLRRDFFNFNMFNIPQGSGSGFVWDQDGHIITNYHVIQDASQAQVTLADQSVWEAQRVGVAPSKAMAVLFIEAPRNKLKPLAIGTSSDLQVGQNVYAIGAVTSCPVI